MSSALSRAQQMSPQRQSDRLDDLPDGNDHALYEKMFNIVRHPKTGEIISAQAPMFMSADEIMRTHKLIQEHNEVPRRRLVDNKYDEAFTRPQDTYSGRNFNPGDGSGAGVAESIEAHGYSHNHPIPLGIKGIRATGPFGGKATEENVGPTVANGQHRLAYMWMHHPDKMLPIDADVHRDVFDPEHQKAAVDYISGKFDTATAKAKLKAPGL